jgi:hypothetical protein
MRQFTAVLKLRCERSGDKRSSRSRQFACIDRRNAGGKGLSDHCVFPITKIIDQGNCPMFERADCHQRIDLCSRNGELVTLGRAFGALSINTLNDSAAHPLNAEFVCRHINVHSKATMLKCHNPSRHTTKLRPLDVLDDENGENASRLLRSLQRGGQGALTRAVNWVAHVINT